MKRDIKFTIRFSKKEIEKIEKVANEFRISKSKVIRNMSLAGLEDAELLHKMGAFEIVKMIEEIREKVAKHERQPRSAQGGRTAGWRE